MKFSVCIPNYNYERYLGATLRSVLSQDGADLEVIVSDNASSDRSLDVVRGFDDPRVQVRVNATNVGFSGNLDRAAGAASGDILLMLSSDDLVRPGALKIYQRLFDSLGIDARTAVVSSASEIIDSDDRVTGVLGRDPELWSTATEIEGPDGVRVFKIDAGHLLRSCLKTFRNPFNFLSTAYPRELYQRVEGYGGGRLIAPDKWFHWRLLGVASHAYFVDAPLFAYRWHGGNQVAQQAKAGALKYLVDGYVSSFEVPDWLLERAGLTRSDVERAFVEYDVVRHGLAELARGGVSKARRILFFGASAYPTILARNRRAWALAGLVSLGPLGHLAARWAYRRSPGRRS